MDFGRYRLIIKATSFSILLLLVPFSETAAADSKAEFETLEAVLKDKRYESFNDFLRDVKAITPKESSIQTVVTAFLAEPSHDSVPTPMARLLGLYARIQHGKETIAVLKEMVRFQTFLKEGVAQHESPEMKAFGTYLKSLADSYGLIFIDTDQRVFELVLPGKTTEDLGIVTHCDVVPVVEQAWVLPDQSTIDPFQAKLLDGKIYGRGTEDDKASIAAAIAGMRAIKDSGIRLQRSIRLIIDTSEETSSEAMKYYMEQRPMPAHNIVLDSSYPVVIAEKGYGMIYLEVPYSKAAVDKPQIILVTGGAAGNQIPETSTLSLLPAKQFRGWVTRAKKRSDAFKQKYPGDYSFTFAQSDEQVYITLHGKSAHSSAPGSGLNPLSRILTFVGENKDLFALNHFTDLATLFADTFGIDDYAKKLGVAYSDSFMGPLSASPTVVSVDSKRIRLGINLRAPKGKSPDQLKAEIGEQLASYQRTANFEYGYEVYTSPYMYRNPKGAWLQTLLDIFQETTGLPAEPVSSSGGTTAKLLPNAVNFGPSMPGQRYTGHTSLEFKRVDNLFLDMRMYTEMMVRIGNLKDLESLISH